MAGVRKRNRGLPPHMAVRRYTNKRGEVWISYYYETPRDENGKKRLIPLGSDLDVARRKWAELEGTPVQEENCLSDIFEKYIEWAENRDVSGLSVRTISDYKSNWRALAPVFGKLAIDRLRSEFLLRYFDKRSSKVRAKKEVKFLGTLHNWAKARGYATTANPVTGITRQMRAPSRRSMYVTDADFALVRKHAIRPVQDAMDIALLTGQRPADVFKMQWSDISDGVLNIKQNKTDAVVRIAIEGQLADVLKAIRSRPVISRYIVSSGGSRPLSLTTFKRAFADARDKAEIEAQETGVTFQRWQFRDLRAKAATDSETQSDAQKLLGHKNEATTVIYRRDSGAVVSPLKRKANG